MKLFDRFAHQLTPRGFHSTIVTTFGVEFTAFEQVLVPQFFGSGSGNIVLLADPGMVALALGDGGAMPTKAGAEYVVHTPRSQSGVFHPKIVFQAGRDGARVVVGSANATSAGLAGNREVVTQVECRNTPSPERAFAVAVWHYLVDLVDGEPGPARDALTWLEVRTPWLVQAEDDPTVRSWDLADGSRLGFWANEPGQEVSIADRFAAELGSTSIEQMVVISPYWDGGLVALRSLISALRPTRTIVLIQPKECRFPTDALRDLNVEIKAFTAGEGSDATRFSHAKLVVATGGGYDYVLSGSANCTVAAMGLPGRKGQNAEACAYRRLPEGTVIAGLNLDNALAGPTLSAADIPTLALDADLPLDEAAAGWPGLFEMEFASLTWRPAPGFDADSVTIELLHDPDLDPVASIGATAWRASVDALKTTVDGEGETARFARAVGPSGRSGLAIISRSEALRARRRERNARGVESVTSQLPQIADLDMRLLELMSMLERADQEEQATIVAPRRMIGKGSSASESETPVQLGYDAFMRIRKPSPQTGREGLVGGRNSLAGSSVDLLRGFLSDLVTGRAGHLGDEILEEDQPGNDDGGARTPVSGRRHGADPAPSAQSRPAQAALDARQIEKAVADYRKTVQAHADAGAIGANHVFRLRLWLLLLLRHRDQLACDDSETGWPRLIVRVLAAFFAGVEAPIKKLAVDPRYDRLPIDMVEAWITVYFALDELASAMPQLALLQGGSKLAPHVARLDATVKSLIGLTEDDLAAADVVSARKTLDDLLDRSRGK